MKIAYTLWTWLMDEYNEWKPPSMNPKGDFEKSLREVSDLQYPNFENFNLLATIYEDCPDEFENLIKKYKINFVCLYHYFTSDFDADMKMGEKCCKFLVQHHAKYLNIQAPWAPETGTTQKELDEMVQKLTLMGELCKKYKVTLCLHPHYGSTVYTESEIDYVISKVSKDLVSICLDTAHSTLAGMDPVKAVTKYMKRLKYIHLKDLDPNYSKDAPMKGFRALGEGTVNFAGIYDALNAGGYDGYLTVECDYQRVCNYATAMVSRDYLHRILGF
jgi:inosose dehydratase